VEQARQAARIEQIASGQHQAPAAPAPAPAPGVNPGMIDAIRQFSEAAEALKQFGVVLTGPGTIGVGAPAVQQQPPAPSPPPPPPVKTEPPKSDEEVLLDALQRFEKQGDLKRRAAKILGVTLPEDEPEQEEEEEEKKEPEKPGLGFFPHVIPNAHWPDGSPMQHATDEKGNWDIGGIVMSNPFIIDKMGSQLLRIVEKVTSKGFGGGPQPPAQETLPEAETEKNGAAPKKDWTV